MATGSDFIILKDNDSTNPLFLGSPILCHTNVISYTGNVLNSTSQKGFQELLNDGEDFSDAYLRRKTDNSFLGFNNPNLTIAGTISKDAISSDRVIIDSVIYKVLTVPRLIQMLYSGHQFLFKDPVLSEQLINYDADGIKIITTDGIPVVFNGTFALKPEVAESHIINYNISLREDK